MFKFFDGFKSAFIDSKASKVVEASTSLDVESKTSKFVENSKNSNFVENKSEVVEGITSVVLTAESYQVGIERLKSSKREKSLSSHCKSKETKRLQARIEKTRRKMSDRNRHVAK